jgi:mRNA interferase RelE/StbE
VKYTLIYTQRAEKDIAGLDSKTKERIGKTLLRYKEEPLRYAEKLSDPILGTYRFRIGGRQVPRKPRPVAGSRGTIKIGLHFREATPCGREASL